jgi:tRNA(Ile)-lysidine synthase
MEVVRKMGFPRGVLEIRPISSGGADSMALLCFFLNCRAELGLSEVAAANAEHGLRGAESVADSAFVRDFCAARGVPFHGVSFKTAADGRGTEDAARRKRYAFFETLRPRYDRIALAHHADDQAETVLLHALRGGGIKGLSGMDYMRGGFYIRPFLSVPKREIAAYLARQGVAHREDATNYSTDADRNYLRAVVLPAIERRWQGAADALARLALNAREDERFIREQIAAHFPVDLAGSAGGGVIKKDGLALKGSGGKKLKSAPSVADGNAVQETVFGGGETALPISCFAYPPSVVSRLVFDALAGAGCGTDAERRHVELIKELALKGGNGAKLELPHGVAAYRDYDRITFTRDGARGGKNIADGLTVIPFSVGTHVLGAARITVTVDPRAVGVVNGQEFIGEATPRVPKDGGGAGVPRNRTLYVDADKVPPAAVFRTRRDGDAFCRFSAGTVKLKDYFIDLKIRARERGGIPLLADGGAVLAVCGIELSEKMKLTAGTKTVYRIETEFNEFTINP